MTRRPALRSVLAVLALVLMTAASGCYNPFQPRLASSLAISKPPPQPNSPAGVINLFQWCWQNRAYDEYQEIFTANYRFVFATTDSSGLPYRVTPWQRTDELNAAQHIFVTGTPSEPSATSIRLDFTQDLVLDIDPRPGARDTTYHRQITAQVVLEVSRGENSYDVQGPVYFNVIRGDSALIPSELQGKFKPDPQRWWIERWVDGTIQGAAFAHAHPVGTRSAPTVFEAEALPGAARARPAAGNQVHIPVTFGTLKALFH